MKHEFLWNLGDALDNMWLLAEGAVALFSDEAYPLASIAQKQGEPMAGAAFNAMGEALYRIRAQIRDVQKAYLEEMDRLDKEEK